MSEPEYEDQEEWGGEDIYHELVKAMEHGEFPKDGQYFDIKTEQTE